VLWNPLCHHAVSVCLSVRVSVMFVHSVKTNKDIFEIFSPSGSHTILVFPYQTEWRYSNGNPSNGGVEYRWGRQKSRFWAYIWLRCLLLMLQQARCCQHGRRCTTATVALVVIIRRWISQNWYKIATQLQWNTNRNLRLTRFRMTLSDLEWQQYFNDTERRAASLRWTELLVVLYCSPNNFR